MSDAPEMLDARLYVFEDQNFVSEKDYRAMMQLAEGFRLERNIMQEMAMKAREAGRREGLELHKEAWGALNFILAFYDSDANRYLDTNAWKRAEASGRRVRAKLRALIDSPKAEGEEPDATR